ncbi:MAG: hypothetical protein WBC53_10790, partial [Phycisphaerae bacterium]
MQRLSDLRLGRRAWTVLAAAATVLAALAAGSGAAWAAGVNVKLPYSIAYALEPIQIDLQGGPKYAIYDLWKNQVAQGNVRGNKTITFTPPKYGWYVVECGTSGKDHMTSGVAKFIGVTPKYANMHTLVQGEMRGGWNDEALQAFTGLLLDRTNTRMGFDNANRVIADCQKYGVTLLMQFESAPTADHVREWVTRMKGKVKYWEVVNEPNFSMSPQAYVNLLRQVYPLIKRIDPKAIVMGPNVCGIQLGWHDAFYKAGGGKFV